MSALPKAGKAAKPEMMRIFVISDFVGIGWRYGACRHYRFDRFYQTEGKKRSIKKEVSNEESTLSNPAGFGFNRLC